jgi:hypothetical protein
VALHVGCLSGVVVGVTVGVSAGEALIVGVGVAPIEGDAVGAWVAVVAAGPADEHATISPATRPMVAIVAAMCVSALRILSPSGVV